jgi:uncharacterized protein (TIGR04255 family)
MADKATLGVTKVFPESPRVIYDKNPLEEVICQLRFPPILRVEESVATFQEVVRKEYPLFKEKGSEQVNIPEQIAHLVRIGNPSFEFTSDDGMWTLVLTRDFIALTARQYRHWEEFRNHLDSPLNVFIEQFSPSFYTRVGLRYRDVIKRSDLGLREVEWAQLLGTHITGELSLPDIAGSVKHLAHETIIGLEDQVSQVQIRHGLARAKEHDEQVYVIDSDFFSTEKTETKDAIERLDSFNRQAGRLFRWCITDRLHEAMGPHLVG